MGKAQAVGAVGCLPQGLKPTSGWLPSLTSPTLHHGSGSLKASLGTSHGLEQWPRPRHSSETGTRVQCAHKKLCYPSVTTPIWPPWAVWKRTILSVLLEISEA